MSEHKATQGVQNKPFKKVRYREQLLRFLADPENDIPSRTTLACEVLKMKYSTHLYRYFSCTELDEILDEALRMRRGRYVAALARVDQGLLRRAAEGDPAAAKLCYQRFEGWEPGEKRKTDMNDELRVAAFRELLKALNEASPGFSDLFADQKDPAFITAEVGKENEV